MKRLFALAFALACSAAICAELRHLRDLHISFDDTAVVGAPSYAFCFSYNRDDGPVIVTDVFPWHNGDGCTRTLRTDADMEDWYKRHYEEERVRRGECLNTDPGEPRRPQDARQHLAQELEDLWMAYAETRHISIFRECRRLLSAGEAKRLRSTVRIGTGVDGAMRTDWRPPTPEEPPAEDGKLYGAFARNSNGDVGWSWDHPTRSEADDAADGKCESHGESCRVFARFHDTCAAYAASSRGAYGWATNKDKGAAESGALGQCRRTGDDSCAVKVAYCMPTDGSSPAAVATTEEAQVSFYGALAAAGPRGAAGWWVNRRTQREADDGAVSECRNHGGGGNCSVVVQFRNACAAYAGDQAQGSSAYGWGIDKDRVSAENRALTECRKRQGSQCRVRVQGCTTRP